MLGQTNAGGFGRSSPFFRTRAGRFPYFGMRGNAFPFWYPGYFSWYYAEPYPSPYWYGSGPYYYGEGAAQEYGSEMPQSHRAYLEYSVREKSLQEEAKSGKALAVRFDSDPSGATITVDGYFMGRTPTTARIPFGEHLVTLTKWGYEWWEQELNVEGNKPLGVSAQLQLFGVEGREFQYSRK